MLIEFSVSNFRSFRERQTLSMVAAPGLGKEGNVFAAPVDGEKLPDLLKVAAVYGPNASGKSNLLRALETLSTIAGLEPQARPRPLPVAPFRFDANLIDQPSTFEVHFIANRMRYAFIMSASAERIVEERLAAFPAGEEALLYHRKRDEYEFGAALEGEPVLHRTWSQATNPQVLFLSRAVAHSNESLQQLRHPHFWLTGGVQVILGDLSSWQQYTQVLVSAHPNMAVHVVNLLNDNDIPVSAVRSTNFPQTLLPAKEQPRTTLTHKTVLGEAQFDFDEESDGTKNLFGFAIPWRFARNRSVFAIDEFDSSLHPDIVATLVRKHIESETPTQMIFTTHDTHLMTTKLLRRDQLWLTERDANGATQLRSVHDFEGSENEDIEKRYFEGRYRALPLVRRG
jgi:energy-coupling factor transporter ATP-binding protein EcfA2